MGDLAAQTWPQLASQGLEGDTGTDQPRPLAHLELRAAADPSENTPRPMLLQAAQNRPSTQERESLDWKSLNSLNSLLPKKQRVKGGHDLLTLPTGPWLEVSQPPPQLNPGATAACQFLL